MKNIRSILFLLCIVVCNYVIAGNTIDLGGVWKIALDSTDIGIKKKWYNNCFSDSIILPGTTDDAGLGITNQLLPLLEKPQMLHLTRKNAYIGVAWYSREITVPKNMSNRPLMLLFERVMWRSQLWIDGKEIGTANESLTTPHRYSLPEGLPAGKHIITLRIDNRKHYDISIKDLAHAYTNDTQIMWNGILGRMELEAKDDVSIEQVDVYPNITNRTVKVRISLNNWLHKDRQIELNLQALCPERNISLEKQTIKTIVKPGKQVVDTEYMMNKDVGFWNEFNPEIYKLNVLCKSGKQNGQKEVTFGMREISANRFSLEINGNRVFLRGTLECCIFPLTGTPPMTEKGWEKVFSVAKTWGLNHLRFHSWCPPQAAFKVADKMGFYLQIELPNWSLTVGKDENTNRFLYNEFERIIAEYGNHPSFCLFSAGNELQPDFVFLNDLVRYMKNRDNRHLYTTTTFTFEKGHGNKPEPEDDFFITQWTDNGWVRGQGIFGQEAPDFSKDYSIASKDIHVPLISHEIGQYAVYPNLKEIDKYTGVLEPLNFKAVSNDLKRKNLLNKADDFLKASGKLAVLLYKEEIERAIKTPKFSGFQLLDLHDFPGQGTALVGLLDAFWDSKGLTEPSFFRQFCAPVVPLARFSKATYYSNEVFTASIEVANYSNDNLQQKNVIWKLTDCDSCLPIAQGVLDIKEITKGGVSKIGFVKAGLNKISKACKLNFEISIEGTNWKNNWNIWVYPELEIVLDSNVLVTSNIYEALEALDKGKKVLLSPPIGELKGLAGNFLPVFWSPVHFPEQAGTMGLLCNPSHPAFLNFPTDMHSDWQWWNLVKKSKVLIVDSLRVDPIVEVIDNFANNRRLVSIFEAKCGHGKLVMSAMDLLSYQDSIPEVKQLFYSLITYMQSEKFEPVFQVSKQEIKNFFLKDKKNQRQ